MAGPSAQEFAALVADLRAEIAAAPPMRRTEIFSLSRQPPAAFGGRPWVHALVSLRQAAPLTGYSLNTLKRYTEPAAARRHPWGRFPAPDGADPAGRWRTWRISSLAIWAADRDPASGKPSIPDETVTEIRDRLAAGETAWVLHREYGLSESAVRHLRDLDGGRKAEGRTGRTGYAPRGGFNRKPGRPAPDPGGHLGHASPRPARRRRRDAAAAAFITALVAARPGITLREACEACEAAGVEMSTRRRRAVMDAARAAALPAILDDLAACRPSGLVTPREIAAAFGTGYWAVRGAMSRGEIRAVRDGRNWLADPSRLRFRKERRLARPSVPADRDHPDAVPLPGEEVSAGAAA